MCTSIRKTRHIVDQEKNFNSNFIYTQAGLYEGQKEILLFHKAQFTVKLWNKLYIFSYNIRAVRQPEGSDYTACTEFAIWCLKIMQANESLLSQVICSDECVLHVVRKLDKNNVRCWGMNLTQKQRERARDNAKVIVFSVMSVNQVFKLYYLVSPVVTGASYKHLLTR